MLCCGQASSRWTRIKDLWTVNFLLDYFSENTTFGVTNGLRSLIGSILIGLGKLLNYCNWLLRNFGSIAPRTCVGNKKGSGGFFLLIFVFIDKTSGQMKRILSFVCGASTGWLQVLFMLHDSILSYVVSSNFIHRFNCVFVKLSVSLSSSKVLFAVSFICMWKDIVLVRGHVSHSLA